MPEDENSTGIELSSLSSSLARTQYALALTRKLLIPSTERKRRELIEFLVRMADKDNFTIRMLSEFYPLNPGLLEKYADYLKWDALSCNPNLPWSEDLLSRFEEKWSWSSQMLDTCRALPWSEALIARFEERWNWYWLSDNITLPWSESLLARFEERWVWQRLILNITLPRDESLLARFEKRWDWHVLSRRKTLPWSEALLERFSGLWDWQGLSGNSSLPWTTALIKRFSERWDWRFLSGNEGLPWSDEFIDEFQDRWTWKYEVSALEDHYLAHPDERSIEWHLLQGLHGLRSLSQNPKLPWSKSLIARYEDRWDWKALSRADYLLWSEDLIISFEDNWNWGSRWYWHGGGLSRNTSIPWNSALINRFWDRWSWSGLTANSSVALADRILIEPKLKHQIREEVDRLTPLFRWAGLETESMDIWFCRLARLRCVQDLLWSEDVISKLGDNLDWGTISSDTMLLWNEDIISQYEARWAWSQLSKNPSLPWSETFISRYEGRWDWNELSSSPFLPWSESFISRYEDRWNWNWLSNNETLPWSELFIDRFKDKWNWNRLGNNDCFPWSAALAISFKDQWDWGGHEDIDGTISSGMIHFQPIHWDEEMIMKLEGKVNVSVLAEFGRDVKWTISLIERYCKDVYWGNKLSDDVYSNIIRPYADDALVEEVMQRIIQTRARAEGAGAGSLKP
ncbi:MAG TPA: hypothetical protein PLS92_12610 [Flavobacteriales bacterium]|nr:hypothetical protein [Flavobacteriales bacterium]QQS72562.1 MAG: hypothetical protein IPP95_15575 [Flavobacteriales bacterium]HQV39832.1 hypothetical protein [Flavobacteriales bacterium]HQW33248.1 hypothetical protein [Flavobacteriales bacterium]HQY03932.1 hypothetical protein [Flavobacteriales bacterium]